jgi:hypothetical protein
MALDNQNVLQCLDVALLSFARWKQSEAAPVNGSKVFR